MENLREMFLYSLCVAMMGISFHLLVEAQKYKSRAHNVSRQFEALKRTAGNVDPAYVCFGGSAKEQLEHLLQ